MFSKIMNLNIMFLIIYSIRGLHSVTVKHGLELSDGWYFIIILKAIILKCKLLHTADNFQKYNIIEAVFYLFHSYDIT